jgi:hypothetical protein
MLFNYAYSWFASKFKLQIAKSGCVGLKIAIALKQARFITHATLFLQLKRASFLWAAAAVIHHYGRKGNYEKCMTTNNEDFA